MPNPAPPQAQAPQDDSVKLQKWAGLKNTVDRERLGPDELEKAINIDLDDVGQAHRRQGQTLLLPGACGSLFTTTAGKVILIKDGVLGVLLPNLTFQEIEAGYENVTLAYVQVGTDIYFSGGASGVSGIIDENTLVVNNWGPKEDFWLSPVVNPTATLPAIRGRLLGKPPAATVLGYWNGQIWLAQGRLLWHTELFTYGLVDKTKNFYQYEADITMIGPVTDGIYVGTTEGVWFTQPVRLGRTEENKGFKRDRVMDSGVIPGTMVSLPSELANPAQVGLDQETPMKVSIAFMTNEGFCGGQDGGTCYNFTEEKFAFPQMVYGAAMFRRQAGMNQYVVAGNSVGDPVQHARIGDYVDAQIVRAGDWRQLEECLKITDTFTVDII